MRFLPDRVFRSLISAALLSYRVNSTTITMIQRSNTILALLYSLIYSLILLVVVVSIKTADSGKFVLKTKGGDLFKI